MNYANEELSKLLIYKNRKRGLEKPTQEFYDFGISLILDCNKNLYDFEKQYIFEKSASNNFSDVWNLFSFLCKNEYNMNPCYSFNLFIELLMNISDFEKIKGILYVFKDKREDLIYILNKFKEENIVDNYYKFLIVWSSFFNNHYIIRDYIRKYDKLETVFNELESATLCEELKSKINNFRQNILFLYNSQGEILDDII